MESLIFGIICIVLGAAGILYVVVWLVDHSPLYCACYDGPHEFNGERVKCQWEILLDAEIKQHANTKTQLWVEVGNLEVARAEVSRLQKELDYLQLRYEKLKEKERVTVLPSFSELYTDPNPARMVFSGEEVVEDTIKKEHPIYPYSRAEVCALKKSLDYLDSVSQDDSAHSGRRA